MGQGRNDKLSNAQSQLIDLCNLKCGGEGEGRPTLYAALRCAAEPCGCLVFRFRFDGKYLAFSRCNHPSAPHT